MVARGGFDTSSWRRGVRLMVAAFAWIAFAVIAFLGLSQAMRILTLGLLTARLVIATVYELVRKDAGARWISLFVLVWAICAATFFGASRFAPPEQLPNGPLIAGTDATPSRGCKGQAVTGDRLLMIFGGDGAIGRGMDPSRPCGSEPVPPSASPAPRRASRSTPSASGFRHGNLVSPHPGQQIRADPGRFPSGTPARRQHPQCRRRSRRSKRCASAISTAEMPCRCGAPSAAATRGRSGRRTHS